MGYRRGGTEKMKDAHPQKYSKVGATTHPLGVQRDWTSDSWSGDWCLPSCPLSTPRRLWWVACPRWRTRTAVNGVTDWREKYTTQRMCTCWDSVISELPTWNNMSDRMTSSVSSTWTPLPGANIHRLTEMTNGLLVKESTTRLAVHRQYNDKIKNVSRPD